ncbi:MAG: cell division topological specificity factor MinE [Thermaerobacterales bacterium]
MWRRWFSGLTRRGKGAASKNRAKERLRLVLVHDRAAISPQLLDAMKEDILATISRYMDIDRAATEVDLSRDGESMALTANIPIRSLRRERT